MSILEKHLAFVNEQVAVQEKLARKYPEPPWRHQMHLSAAEKFRSLAADIEAANKELDSAPNRKAYGQLSLNLTPEDIEGLPEELVKELSISDADRTEFAIRHIIDEAGGVLSLDKILIAYYKKKQEVMKRVTMTSRLYRMVTKKLLYNVPNKKGVYSTRPITETESDLFSKTKEEDSQ
jgi:hypothetical protein